MVVYDFIAYVDRVEGNELCKCMHRERDHTFEGTKCMDCICEAYDKSNLAGESIQEMMLARTEALDNA